MLVPGRRAASIDRAWPNFDQNSVRHTQDAVHAPRQFEIVRGDQGRNACATNEIKEQFENVVSRVWIEISGRLIGEDEFEDYWPVLAQSPFAAAPRPTARQGGD